MMANVLLQNSPKIFFLKGGRPMITAEREPHLYISSGNTMPDFLPVRVPGRCDQTHSKQGKPTVFSPGFG